jgi:putative transcriptional regulator
MKRKEVEFDAESLVASVEAMASHVRSEPKLTLRSHVLTLPEAIAPVRPKDVAAIRRQLNVSQSVFAALLNVLKATAISWEKGRRKPTGRGPPTAGLDSQETSPLSRGLRLQNNGGPQTHLQSKGDGDIVCPYFAGCRSPRPLTDYWPLPVNIEHLFSAQSFTLNLLPTRPCATISIATRRQFTSIALPPRWRQR